MGNIVVARAICAHRGLPTVGGLLPANNSKPLGQGLANGMSTCALPMIVKPGSLPISLPISLHISASISLHISASISLEPIA